MTYFSTFFTWLFTGTNGFLFASGASAFLFIVMIAVLLINAMRKIDLTKMFYDPGLDHVSTSKFWHVVACFVATIAFLFINITAPGTASLEFIWLTYLGVIAGSASFNSLVKARFGGSQQMAQAPMMAASMPMQHYPQEPYVGGTPEPMMTPTYPVYQGQPVRSCSPDPN